MTKSKTQKNINLNTYLNPMKELKLTIAERVAAATLMSQFKGDYVTRAILAKDAPGLAVTKEDWDAAKLVKSPTDAEITALPEDKRAGVQQSLTWQDEGSEKKVFFAQQTFDFLLQSLDAKKDYSFSAADNGYVKLVESLNKFK
jgi:hypothetical protein